jgi:hypothetical protein
MDIPITSGVYWTISTSRFSQCAYKMGRTERDYWMDPNTIDTIGEARASFAAGASRRIEAIDDMLETFEDGAEVAPGVTADGDAGAHAGAHVFRGVVRRHDVMVIGDAVSNDHVAMARPDWPSGSDQDTRWGPRHARGCSISWPPTGCSRSGSTWGRRAGPGRTRRRRLRFVTDL